MNETEIEAQLAKYSFYHIIELTPTLSTPGEPALVSMQEIPLAVLETISLEGKRVLDIGCRDGLFSFLAERRGASEVIGIDNDLSPAAVEFLIPFFGSSVQMFEMNVTELGPERFGLFDAVLFLGTLYHLRYPFWSLRNVSSVIADGGLLVLETAVLLDEDRDALLYCPTGDESPYEPTSVSFFNLKGLRDTLATFGLQVEDVSMSPVAMNWIRVRRRTSEMAKDLIRQILGRRRRPGVGRATLLCRKMGSYSSVSELDEYWNGSHTIHTDMYLPDRPKRTWWMGK